jgi:hypothetical protein
MGAPFAVPLMYMRWVVLVSVTAVYTVGSVAATKDEGTTFAFDENAAEKEESLNLTSVDPAFGITRANRVLFPYVVGTEACETHDVFAP